MPTAESDPRQSDAEAFGRDEHGTERFAATLLLFRDTTPTAAVFRRDFCGNDVIERTQRLLPWK